MSEKTKEEILEEIENELTDIEDYTSSIDAATSDTRDLLEELKKLKDD